MHLRTCSKCERKLRIENFSKKGWVSGKQRYRSQCKKCHSEYEKTLVFRIMQKKYHSAPNRRKRDSAGEKLRMMVKKGIIKKLPCIVCGNEKSEGHHFNYDKPFEVVWLCREHHNELHYFNSVKVG